MPGKPIDAVMYSTWGKKLAHDFLHSKVPLNEGLKKIAEENNLNPEQIQRVAELANHCTYGDLLPHREGGDIRFDKAESSTVVRDMNGPVKIAADLTDYLRTPPRRSPDVGRVLVEQFGDNIEKIAEELESREIKPEWTATDFQLLLHKLEKCGHELELERMDIMRMTKEAKEKFAEIVRRMVTNGYKVEDLYKAALDARPDQKDAIKELFSESISDLGHRGYFGVKTAEPVKPALISAKLDKLLPKGVQCEVVNGKHPLTLSIDAVSDLVQKWWENQKGLNITRAAVDKAKRVTTNILHRGKLKGV